MAFLRAAAWLITERAVLAATNEEAGWTERPAVVRTTSRKRITWGSIGLRLSGPHDTSRIVEQQGAPKVQ